MFIEAVQELTSSRWLALSLPVERIFWLYILSAIVIGAISWLYYRYLAYENAPENAKKNLLGFLFDSSVFWHRSAKQDYIYFFLNGLIYVGILSQLLLSTHFFMIFSSSILDQIFGAPEAPIISSSLIAIALYTIVVALCMDFAVFITHYLQHKIPLLWQFHQVHHSAEVLTPITVYRMHPVDLFFTGVVLAVLAGFAYGGFYWLTQTAPSAYEIMGVNIIVFLYYLLGYNLRHSHIWINYPKWLSNILISPAQHQIHHSIAPKHWDKNMGLIFSFWDKLFGTLYIPEKYEKIEFGLNKKKPNPFDTVMQLYIKPFQNAWEILSPGGSTRAHIFTVLGVLIFSGLVYYMFFDFDKKALAVSAPPTSVHIENLTWTEIQRGMDMHNFDTIIIPTGGTEQNGGHMITGKHNIVVRYTAEQIAKDLGRSFVAPVMAYVPEEIHMNYAGTIDLPPSVFEQVLEATARSFQKHGFQYIFFIGDSVGNQEPQKNVAQRLDNEWPDVRVVHVDHYYSRNGQLDWLRAQGFEDLDIGGHAGIRDTSELLFLDRSGVRKNPLYVVDRDTGHNGDFKKASKKIGEKMLSLKIEAALSQIREVRGDLVAADNLGDGKEPELQH